jgi:hypothetical protein
MKPGVSGTNNSTLLSPTLLGNEGIDGTTRGAHSDRAARPASSPLPEGSSSSERPLEGVVAQIREVPGVARTIVATVPGSFAEARKGEGRMTGDRTVAGQRVTDLPAVDASLSGQLEIGGEVTVSRLGFGAMRITGPGIRGEPGDHDEARRVLRRAVEART